MHPDIILVRTQQGERQIQKSAIKLDQRHKVALWLVDGVRSVAEILDVAGVERTIEPWYELIQLDLIRPQLALSPPVSTMSTLRQQLACIAICHLGHAALPVYKIIENMQETKPGLADAIRKIERLVKLTIDAAQAKQLADTYRKLASGLERFCRH